MSFLSNNQPCGLNTLQGNDALTDISQNPGPAEFFKFIVLVVYTQFL